MAMFKKDLLARYILAVLAFALFSLNVVTSSHFAPESERQLITLHHQVRRVLMRAERENLRSSAASEGVVITPPQEQPSAAPRPMEIPICCNKTFFTAQILFQPASLFLESSPVLIL